MLKNIKFTKSKRKNKKYKVEFLFNGKKHTLHFGALGYAQYKDKTPLGLYSQYDHNDKNRRKRYYARHGITNNPLSAKYWSNLYLW